MKSVQEVRDEEKKIFDSVEIFLMKYKGCTHTQAQLVASTLVEVMVAMVKMEPSRNI